VETLGVTAIKLRNHPFNDRGPHTRFGRRWSNTSRPKRVFSRSHALTSMIL